MSSPADGAAAAAAGATDTGQQQGEAQPAAAGQGPAGAGKQQGAKGAGGQDPAALYAEYLVGIPAQLHGTVTEAFKKWDANVTRSQQDVRSQLAAYQPLIDGGHDPQQLQAAAQFMEWLQEDPAAALQMAAAELGVDLGGTPQGGAPVGPGGPEDEGAAGQVDPQGEIPPWYQPHQQQLAELKQLVEVIGQGMLQQHQAQQLEQQTDQVEQALVSAMQAAGIDKGDEHATDYILTKLAATPENIPPEQAAQQAVQAYQKLTQSIGGQRASAGAPPILPAGGGLPTQQVDPQTLSQKDRRALAVQRARELQAGGQ